MIPILFEKNATSFNNNGICRLFDCISVKVVEERNSIYECDFDYPIGGVNFSEIQCGRIIGVTHDDTGDIQPFDIISYEKPIDGIVTFHAVHISYRLKGYVVDQTEANSLADALTKLATATPSNSFTYTADFSSTGYAGAFNGIPRSVRQLLGGIEGSILDTYGGEYEWDKFQVKLHQQRGNVVNFAIRYGVNMVDFNDDTDYANTYTTAIPYWIGDDGEGGQTIVKGSKVNSGLTPFDGHERCVPLDLSDKFETAPTTTDLENLALSMMVSRSVNLPKQTIKVDFVRLQDYDEYTLLSNLYECKLCDSIEVIFPDYSMSGFFKIVRTEYDVLEDKYSAMELGALATTLSQALGIGEQSSGTTSGGGSAVRYGVCSTGGNVVAKTVTVSPPITGLTTGMLVFVKFDNANTSANPTLDVNGTGAKAIKRYGTTAPSTSASSSWNAGSMCALVYDGTYWQMVGWLNTTYSSMTQAEIEAGTGTTARIITPARLKYAIDYWGGGGGSSPYTSNPEMDGTASAGTSNLYSRGDHVHPTDTSRQATLVSGTNIKSVNGNSLLGSGDLTLPCGFHGVCSTSSNVANKVVTSTPTFVNSTGSLIAITFADANTVEGLISLKIDNDSYRPIYVNGAVTSSTNALLWEAGETILFQCVLRGPQNTYEYLAKSGGDGGTITDVQVNGASVVSNGIATIPKATGSQFGVIEIGSSPGALSITSGTSTYNSALLTSGMVSSSVLPDATQSTKGAMTSADKTKLDGIDDGAEVNVLEGVQKNGTDLPITNKKVNIPLMTGATANASGSSGLVPMPSQGQQSYLLFGDGYWENLYVSTASSSGTKYRADIERYNTGTVLASIQIPTATSSLAGAMSSADRDKLDGIPDVTSADNGKVMRVVNGVWSAVALPSASGVNF